LHLEGWMAMIQSDSAKELHRAMAGHVEQGDIPGIVTLIARGDEVFADAVGRLTVGGDVSMRRDSIFRIASITKPIAAAAVMILVDEGKLRLDDSVEPWLPELANRRVLRSIDAQLDDTVPARRVITVRDLLTFTFGFGSVMAMPGTYPIQRPIAEGHLGGDGPPRPSLTPGPDEWMRRLGALPLMSQPGERWAYNTGSDVQGVLVERVSGISFGEFLRKQIFDPLGMTDTGFWVAADKLHRLVGVYRMDYANGKLEAFDSETHSEYARSPAFESGAGGLVSTADDYFAFCRMMLNKGRFEGERILSEDSVKAMTSNQLAPEQRQGAELFFGNHSSWGFGVGITLRAAEPWMVPGSFGWTGGFGTVATTDPVNDCVSILMTQRLMDSPEPPPVFRDFGRLAHSALVG
jgi:CubicO group peptidase (beta-lactamase class C family)